MNRIQLYFVNKHLSSWPLLGLVGRYPIRPTPLLIVFPLPILTYVVYVIISDFMSDFDILCFSESHLDRTILDADLTFDTHESSIYRQDMTSHSGGLIAYVSNSLFSKRRYDLEHNLVHSMWIEVKYRSTSFLLCTVYRSPNTTVAFWDYFNISLEKAL